MIVPMPGKGGGILHIPDELAYPAGKTTEDFEKELMAAMTMPIPAHGGPTRWVSAPPAHNTGRVLVAFLDENDDPIWSEVLPALNCQVDFPGAGEVPRMQIEFGLYSVAKP